MTKGQSRLTKYKLADVATIDVSTVDKKSKEGEIPVRLCNFVDVYKQWAITESLHDSMMEATANQRQFDKFKLRKGQVAITKDSETRDDIGIATYIADDFENVVLGYHCALISPKEGILDGRYLNAFMHSSYIQKYFENNATGSGMRYTLSTETMNSIPILMPTYEEQREIGMLLADIDRKIELNRSLNHNLRASREQSHAVA